MKRLYFILLGISLAFAVPPYRLPYFENFEGASATEWIAAAGNANGYTWALGTPAKAFIQGAYSGTRAWMTGQLNGVYADDENSTLTSPIFDFSNVVGFTRVNMVIRYDTEEGWDGAQLQYTINGGATWIPVGGLNDPINWYNDIVSQNNAAIPDQPAWTGPDSGWLNASHTLPTALGGHSVVQLRIAFGSDGSNEGDGFVFDDFEISVPTQAVLCPSLVSPVNGFTSANTYETFSWTRAAGEVDGAPFGYHLYLDTVNPPVSFFDVGLSTNFSTIVAASSTYYWTVVAVGYNGTISPNCGVSTLTTPFEPVISTIPYNETFEANNGFWVPLGSLSTWQYGNPNKSVIQGAHSGNNAWVTGGLTGQYGNKEMSYLLSPAFDLSAVTQPLIFSVWIWYYTDTGATSQYDGANLQYTLDEGTTWITVGAFGDPSWYNSANISGFSPKADAWGGNSGGYVLRSHILPDNILGQNPVHLRFNFGSDFTGTFDGISIDDIQLDFAVIAAPQCPELLPTEGTNPVVLKWQPAAGDPVVIQRYLVYYGLTLPPNILLYNGTSTNATTPLLRSGTTYYWSVTALGFENLPSPGCVTSNFTTLASPTVTLPYTENFETSNGNWTAGGTLSTWVWGAPHKTTISSAHSGSNVWINGGLDAQYAANEKSYVMSPIVDFSSIAVPTYVSYYIQYEVEGGTFSQYDGMNLQFSVDYGQTWTVLGLGNELNWYNSSRISALQQPGWNGHTTAWQFVAHLLPTSINGQPEVRFRIQFASDDYENDDGVAFDNFSVGPVTAPAPLCPVFGPTPVGSPAVISWTRNPAENFLNPSSYILYFDTHNPPTTVVYNNTGYYANYSYTDSVPAGATYYYSVSPVSVTGVPVNCPPVSFTVPVELIPYAQTFESGTAGWHSEGQDSTWAFGTPNKPDIQGAYSGVHAWVNGGLNGTYNADELSYLYSPSFTFGTINAATYVAFAINFNTEQSVGGTTFDGINLQYTTDYGATWFTVGVNGDPHWYTTSTVESIPDTNDRKDGFGGRSGGYIVASHLLPTTLNGLLDVKFRFQFASDYSNELAGVAIDDFTIQLVPTNTPPKCAIFDGAVGNPMVISWHKDPTDSALLPQGYNVYLSSTNPPTTLVASGTQTDLHTGLAYPGATYYLKIVPYGFNNLNATSCNVITFQVPTAPVEQFPYYENFENGPGGWEASANPENPNGIISSWAFGTPTAPRQIIRTAESGSYVWSSGGLNGTDYPDDEDSYVISPVFDFTSLTSDPFVSLFITYDLEHNFDGARLEVITPTTQWTVVGDIPGFYSDDDITAFNGEIGWSGLGVTWILVSNAVPSVAGTIARFRIHYATDDSGGHEGFAFDNFAIQSTSYWTQGSTFAPPTSVEPTSFSSPATSAPATSAPVSSAPTSQPQPQTSSTTDNELEQAKSSSSLSSGAIAAAIIIPIVVVAIIVGIVAYVLVKRKTPVNKNLAVAEHELDEVENKRAAV